MNRFAGDVTVSGGRVSLQPLLSMNSIFCEG